MRKIEDRIYDIYMYMYTVLEKTVIMNYLLLFLSVFMIIVECFHYFNRQWLRFLSLTLPFVSKIIVINSSNIPLLVLEFPLVEYGNPRKIGENLYFFFKDQVMPRFQPSNITKVGQVHHSMHELFSARVMKEGRKRSASKP